MTETIAEDWMAVGYRLQTEGEINMLPEGTVIEAVDDEEEWYEKRSGGWHASDGSVYDGGFNGGGYNRIRSLPEQTGQRFETAVQYAWRYRCHVINACVNHGYSYDMALRAVADIGYTDESFPFGVGMVISTNYDSQRVPEESAVHIGEPDNWSSYGVFVRRNRRFYHILGGNRYMGERYVVDSVAGEEVRQAWIDTPGTAESVTEVLAVKAKAYKVGRLAKRANSWCETYDHIVAQVGVDRSAARIAEAGGVRVGMTLSARAVRDLPVGTVLRWRHHDSPDTRVVWFVRAADSVNTAGTRRVFGYRDDHPNRLGNLADSMEVMAFPQETDMETGEWCDIDVDIMRAGVWDLIPVGTHLVYHDSHYVKAANGGLSSWYPDTQMAERGTYQIGQFSRDLHVVSFPTP